MKRPHFLLFLLILSSYQLVFGDPDEEDFCTIDGECGSKGDRSSKYSAEDEELYQKRKIAFVQLRIFE